MNLKDLLEYFILIKKIIKFKKYMKDNFLIKIIMDLGDIYGKMDHFMLENGIIIILMVKD